MGIVLIDPDVVIMKVENRLHGRVENELRQGARLARKLQSEMKEAEAFDAERADKEWARRKQKAVKHAASDAAGGAGGAEDGGE